MILGLISETVSDGARLAKACQEFKLATTTVQRWKKRDIGEDNRAGPRTPPSNKLSDEERREVLRVVNEPGNSDLSPKQLVPRLADLGKYIGSESTVYRILREEEQLTLRGPAREPVKRHKPRECAATGPNQVWSWDITYLRSPIRGVFFYFYVVIDVWSRKIVGWTVQARECSELAEQLVSDACERENIERDQLTLHSDNGAPMKGATLLAFLQARGIVASFSRPSVSNDNPYSESVFRTAKYRPEFPRKPFESLEEACAWATWFENWYNTEHRHSAISYVTPAQRHDGDDVAILEARRVLYEKMRMKNPNRWSGATRDWSRVETVTLNPATENEAAAHAAA